MQLRGYASCRWKFSVCTLPEMSSSWPRRYWEMSAASSWKPTDPTIFAILVFLPSGLQDNHSRSAKGVLRGLHFQWEPPMSKLMRVTSGAAFLVAVDIRKGSPTLGQWFGLEVSADNKKQVYAPYGFARGFCALTDWCEVQYKCTGLYNSGAESGISYKDPRNRDSMAAQGCPGLEQRCQRSIAEAMAGFATF